MTDPFRVLIADDEEAPRAQLQSALQQLRPDAVVVATAGNGADAWDAYLEHEPDVCLLDIRMPGLSGLDVARRIGGRADVVFVSAHGDHALSAFEAGVVDYVLKPVEPARLGQALDRIAQRRERHAAEGAAPTDTATLQALLSRLVSDAPAASRLRTLQAAVGKEVRLIPVDDVVYFESDARYTRIVYRSDGEDADALIRTPLKELLTRLDPAQFWQVHRSLIVNAAQIAAAVRIDEGQMQLTLRGRSERLPVSRHFQGLFRGQ